MKAPILQEFIMEQAIIDAILPYVVPASATGGTVFIGYILKRLMTSVDALTAEIHKLAESVAVVSTRIEAHDQRITMLEGDVRNRH